MIRTDAFGRPIVGTGASGPVPAAGSTSSGLSDALASIENRISSLTGQAAPAPAHAGPIMGRVPYGEPNVAGVAPMSAGVATPAYGASGVAPAEISQLRTTISRLTDQINAQVAAGHGASMPRSAAQALPPVGGSQGLPAHAPLSSLAAQVAERKRVLAEEAARREAQPAPQPAPAPQPVAQPVPQPVPVPARAEPAVEQPKPRPATAAAAPRAGNGNAAVRELSAKLDTIKTDLVGMKRALARQTEAVAKQSEAASRPAEPHAIPDQEIERLASGIAALQQAPTFDPAGFDKLGDEIARLRQNMRGDLRDTVRNEVGSAVDQAVSQAAGTSADAMERTVASAVERLSKDIEELAGTSTADASAKVERLSAEFAELRGVVSDLPNTLAINRLEAKLREVAEAVDAAAQHKPSHFELEGFAQIESRLDEISRALVAVGMGTDAARFDPASLDLSGVERLEARMSDLMLQVETLASAQDQAARAQEEAARQQEAAQRELRDANELEAVTQHLVTLSDRLAQIEHHAETSSRAAARALQRTPDLTGLEAQLASLSQRLEESAGSDTTSHQLANLEAQVAGLAVSLGQLDGATGAMDFSPVEARLAEIENRFDVQSDHLAQSFEAAQERLAVSAAQNAAAQVAEALGTHTHDGRSMAALAAELGAVQSALESSENRSAETLDAVRRTLDAVTGRLGAIETGMMQQSDHLERVVAQLMAGPAPAEARVPHAAYAQPAASAAMPPVMPTAAQLSVAASAPRQATTPPPLDAGDVFDDGFDADFSGADEAVLEGDVPIEPQADAAPVVDRERKTVRPDIASIVASATARLNASTARPGAEGVPADTTDMSGEDAVAAFNAANASRPASSTATPDVIAAARRAVLSTRGDLDDGSITSKLSEGSSSIGGALRKPIVVAAGAVALVALAALAGWSWLGSNDAPRAPRISAIEAPVDTARVQTLPDIAVPAVAAPAAEEASAPAPAVEGPRVVRKVVPIERAAAPADRVADSPQAAPAIDEARVTQPEPSAAAAPVIEASAPAAPVAEQPAPQATPEAKLSIPVPAEITEAALRAAAGAGDRLALHEIALRYSEGRGVERDVATAAEWFARSAERGFAPAQYSLGSLYEKGSGVERDTDKAKALYLDAAEKGNARAMHNLAVVHAMGGDGAQADMPTATRWFLEAAALGVKDSQFNLGILYGQGMGVPQNLAESYKWFAVAARTGDKDAIAKRDEVAAAMDEASLKAARSSAEAWRAETPDRATNAIEVPAAWRAPAEPAKQVSTLIKDTTSVKRAQGLLNRIGFSVGRPDGKVGPRTGKALANFQRTWSLPPTGRLDPATMAALEDATT